MIIFVIILGLTGFIYAYFNGTPWGKVAAKKQMMHSLKEQYQPLHFHVVENVGYNFEDNHYNIGITFRKLPQVKYVFELTPKTERAEYVGFSSQNPRLRAPDPIPYSTSWVNHIKVVNFHNKASNVEKLKNFIKHVKTGIPGQIKIKKYTVEGSPIYYELHYNGKKIKYTYDNSHDSYAGSSKGKHSTTCKNIKIKNTDHGAIYVLNGCSSEIGNTFSLPANNQP